MKFLFFLLPTLGFLVSCNSRRDNSRLTTPPKLEMIFGKEKKDLSKFVAYLDSLHLHRSEIKLDTISEIRNDSYLVKDGLSDSIGFRAGRLSGIDMETGEKLDLTKDYYSVETVLKGKTRMSDYNSYIRDLNRVRYFVVIDNILFTRPKYIGGSSFEGGMIISAVQVIDLKSQKIVKTEILQSGNSNEIESNKMMGAIALDEDFWKNYRSAKTEIIEKLFN